MLRGRWLVAAVAVVMAASCGDDESAVEGTLPVDAGDAATGNGSGEADGAAGDEGQGNGGEGNGGEDAASNAGNGGNVSNGGNSGDGGNAGNGGTAGAAGAGNQDAGPEDPGLDASLTVDAADPTDASVSLDASVTLDASIGDAGIADADANFCPSRGAGEVGGPCSSDADCDSSLGAGDGLCARPDGSNWEGWPAAGFCFTIDYAACTTPCVVNPCGVGDVCVALGGCSGCAPACCEGDTCAAGTTCSDRLEDRPDPLFANACVPGDADAVVGDACADNSECKPGSACRLDAEHPGGECSSVACTVGDDATCVAGGHCINENLLSPYCAKVCDSDADCRLAEGYACLDLGGATGKVCRHGHVGDACVTDTVCGDAAIWDCRTGPGFTGGYCTLLAACPTPGSSQGCPAGSSICATGNYCVDRCYGTIGTQDTCRTGYTCQDVDPGASTVGGCLPL